MPSFPDLSAPLGDGHVTLRYEAERDIPEILIAHQDDPQMHARLGAARPPSGAELGTQSERAEADRRAGTWASLTILQPGDEDCRGRVNVHHVDWDHRRAELGIWVAPQVRGRGMARRALRLATGWLFETCAFERLAVVTECDNAPMRRAAAAAGFVEEGVLRGYDEGPSGRVDCVILSLLRTDPASA
jgi:RimJ/RimL family protein N-acetyltransferase